MEGVVPKHVFEPKTVQRMELLVLDVLEWRMRLVTPFNFLAFFAHKLDPTGRYSGFIATQASDMILAAVSGNCSFLQIFIIGLNMSVNLCSTINYFFTDASILQYRPSCIAASALLCTATNIQALPHMESEIAESWCDGLSRVSKLNTHHLT